MFVNLWEFHVKSGMEEMFEKVYGAEGDWARLFMLSSGYRGTRLAREVGSEGRYFTFDYWLSRGEFAAFREKNAPAYAALDKQCETLTISERHIGGVDVIGDLPEN